GPAGLNVPAAGDVLRQAVDVVGDAASRLILAKVVREVDFDRLCHRSNTVGRHSALFKPPLETMIRTMRSLLISLAFLATPIAAQNASPEPEPRPAAPAVAPAAWDPAAPYITAGQDEPGYRSWYLAAPARGPQVKAFNDYLIGAQVGGIVPTWQLLRTATAWQECGAQPFEVPPPDEWPHMVQTLR